MIRDFDLGTQTDGKRYRRDDLVKLGCNGCQGCSACCRDRGSRIPLDPYDVYTLTRGLQNSFQKLYAEGFLEFSVIDGVILPVLPLKKDASGERCLFLDDAGRCRIHEFRPSVCRLFPLGRLYEDGDFSYILQVGECERATGEKIRISRWLSIPDLPKHEAFVREYHELLTELRTVVSSGQISMEDRKKLNMEFLNRWFLEAYDTASDFYVQFAARKNVE